MARKNTPLRDRAVIKSRLVRGFSYSKALEGTSVKSKNTVMLIAREEKDDIGRLRKVYLAMVYSFGGDTEKRAKIIAEMLDATRLFGKRAVEHPDWKARLEAVEYIDRLAGLTTESSGSTVNILNSPDFIKQYDERYK